MHIDELYNIKCKTLSFSKNNVGDDDDNNDENDHINLVQKL